MYGRLIGVGIGPGDPDLLTIKASRHIQNAPVLAYTVDANGISYARKTAEIYIQAGQNELPLYFSMSPDRAGRLASRHDAGIKILDVLRTGRDVVFITEGDPLLYSTFQHLLSEMPSDIPVEVCPGITAMASASAAARFPLAIEGQSVKIAPAEKAVGNIVDWLNQGNTVILYKAARQLVKIVSEIKQSDRCYEAVLVELASTDSEAVIRNLKDWTGHEAPYFSIVLLRPIESEGDAG